MASFDNTPARFRKYYVVWAGRATGVFDTWEETRAQIEGFPGAKYRSFPSQEEAVSAFRGRPEEHLSLARGMAEAQKKEVVNYDAIPEIRLNAIAVDGACACNPGPMEYRGVLVGTGQEVFHIGPMEGGTNNIAEYLAIIHCAALLHKSHDYTTPIYTDSRTALAWIRKRASNTTITPTAKNARVREVLARANAWIKANDIRNPLLKWDTDAWGEIPADFGRK
ncbi:MAG: ribonuclease H family protein [Muribaculaceae bacterium]|nr:ribonuclease H family protein [Muribaculaceae bacterium]